MEKNRKFLPNSRIGTKKLYREDARTLGGPSRLRGKKNDIPWVNQRHPRETA